MSVLPVFKISCQNTTNILSNEYGSLLSGQWEDYL